MARFLAGVTGKDVGLLCETDHRERAGSKVPF